MRKAGFVFVVLLLAELGLAYGQEIPKLPPMANPHARAAFANKQYPSARVCGECHPTQYAQWSISSHAYAAVSPMFNKFEQRINDLARGTLGYFCVRSHATCGTTPCERRDIACG